MSTPPHNRAKRVDPSQRWGIGRQIPRERPIFSPSLANAASRARPSATALPSHQPEPLGRSVASCRHAGRLPGQPSRSRATAAAVPASECALTMPGYALVSRSANAPGSRRTARMRPPVSCSHACSGPTQGESGRRRSMRLEVWPWRPATVERARAGHMESDGDRRGMPPRTHSSTPASKPVQTDPTRR